MQIKINIVRIDNFSGNFKFDKQICVSSTNLLNYSRYKQESKVEQIGSSQNTKMWLNFNKTPTGKNNKFITRFNLN